MGANRPFQVGMKGVPANMDSGHSPLQDISKEQSPQIYQS